MAPHISEDRDLNGHQENSDLSIFGGFSVGSIKIKTWAIKQKTARGHNVTVITIISKCGRYLEYLATP
jgi:hypothetical protein